MQAQVSSAAPSSDAVIVADQTGAIVDVNDVAVRLFGYSRDELLRMEVEDLIPAARRADHRSHRATYEAAPHLRRMGQASPFPAVHRDGRQLLVEVALRAGDGRPGSTTTTAVIRDVTAREAIFTEIGGDANKLRALTAGAFDILWQASFRGEDGGNMIQMFRDLGPDLGYDLGELPRTMSIERWLALMPPEDAARLRHTLAHSLDTSDMFTAEHRLQTRSGGFAWFEVHGRPVEYRDGKPAKYLGAARNITERKNAEEELRRANKELRELKGQLEAENVQLAEEVGRVQGFDEIVGTSPSLKHVLRQIEQVAQSNASVIITGETGTGKELVAHAIHRSSPRRRAVMVTLNCAALPPSLIESELFGHEKGAFTGASARRIGRFEMAHRGTIFLDEIAELPLDLQAKLLRVLESGDCQRVGSSETFKVDVRVLAATNRQLEEAIDKGTFRLDLFYRLSVFPIHVPPLRERREDIPLLAAYLVEKKGARNGRTIALIPRDVLDQLCQYDWPGNVRELENVIERAVILSPGPVLTLADALGAAPGGRPATDADSPAANDHHDWTLEQAERDHIIRVCTGCGWKIKGPGGAADKLGLNASTLYFRMKKLGVARPDEKHA